MTALSPRDSHEHQRVAVTIPCAILVRILRDHLGRLRTSLPPRQWHQAAVAQRAVRPAPAITIVGRATAEGIGEAAEAVETPGEYQAVQLRVAEQYVEMLGLLAKENDTMILAGR